MGYSASTLPDDFPTSDLGPEFRAAPTMPLRIDDIVVEREPARDPDTARGGSHDELRALADLPGGLDFAIDEVLDPTVIDSDLPVAAADQPGIRSPELDLGLIDRERARGHPGLFYLVTSASFIEATAAAECRRLLDWVPVHEELVSWLESRWAPEERQHGEVLRRYVEHVWPEFRWQRGFDGFGRADAVLQTEAGFAATPGLEMLARSVTEVGSAVFYRALQEEASEPHLRQLASRLRHDELRHYRHFQHFFREFDARERSGRKRIARTMWERLRSDRRGRARLALRHVYEARPKGLEDPAGGPDGAAALEQSLARQLHERYPIDMPARMLARSLDLPAAWESFAEPAARLLRRTLA